MVGKVLTAEETNPPMPRENKKGEGTPRFEFKEEFNYVSY